MKITKVKLKNFKSYYGEQELNLSVTDEKNVVVIYADSGYGKTTLLEAINWAFYDEDYILRLNKSRSSKDKLKLESWICEKHIKDLVNKGEIGHMYVEIHFVHENQKQYIHNGVKFTVNGDREISLLNSNERVLRKFSGTIWERSPNPNVAINRILPKNIVDYFFFDAEQQSKLVMPKNQGLVQDAINNVIGLKSLENAALNLKKIAKDYSSELSSIDLGEISQLTAEKKRLEDEIEKSRENLGIQTLEKNSIEEQIQEIENKLIGTEETEKFQKEIENLKFEKESLLISKTEIEKDLVRKIYNGIPFIAKDVIEGLLESLNELRNNGKIPGTITVNLIDEILENLQCICGTDLRNNAKMRKKFTMLKDEVSRRSQEKDKLIDIHSTIKYFSSEIGERNPKELSEAIVTYDNIDEALYNIEEEIKENEKEIGDIKNENIQNLKEKKDELNLEKEEVIINVALLERNIEDYEEDLKKINVDLENSEIQNEQAKKLQKYEQLARKTSEKLSEIFDSFSEITKKEITQIANQQWKKLIKSTKNLNFKIDDSFKFNITDSLGRNALNDLSNGQKQGLVLSFVYAISEVSQKFPPYIIDMPFGRLGEESQKEAARFMPLACQQLILLLNKTAEYNEITIPELKPKCMRFIELDFDPDKRITNIINK